MYDHDAIGSDDLEGIVSISMKELQHQNKVDDWIQLKRPTGEEEMGSLRVRVQLIWSKLHYYSDLIMRGEEQMEAINIELEKINQYLDHINAPFGLVLTEEILEIYNSNILDNDKNISNFSDTKKYLASSKILNQSFATKIDNVFKGVLSKIINYLKSTASNGLGSLKFSYMQI